MSVLITGLKMPENCLKCPMQFAGFCSVSPPEVDERVAPTVDEAAAQGKPSWCPLVEVPTPHGRLVDADILREKWIWGSTDRRSDVECIELIDVDDASTVIDAEE